MRALLAAWALLAASAQAATPADIVQLINDYRATPAACGGQASPAMAPLQASAALAAVHLAPGRFLQQDLAHAGYRAAQVQAIGVSGASTAAGIVQLLREQHCTTLRNPLLTDIGVAGANDAWSIILAAEDIRPPLPSQQSAVAAILAATNRARASSRTCGTRQFAAAPPLAASPALSQAAFVHSTDMATLRYFSHDGKDGSQVGDRARNAGYAWQAIGENIASGMRTPEEAVAGWIGSPGHCANLMNPGFTDMGGGFSETRENGIVLWTQVFGRPQ
ncbi:MAG: CAP domain-containing protein [Pseudomonadota bacterium]|nr:CAP domain-containing protein [Pseudomonadota bacterium]